MWIQTNRSDLSAISPKFVFLVVLSINFAVYSVQSYTPPSVFQESISYSVLTCPSHSNQNPLSRIISHLNSSEGEDRNEKHCLCFSCCNQRLAHVIFKPLTNLSMDEYIISLDPLDDNPYLKEFYKELPIRSPPGLLA